MAQGSSTQRVDILRINGTTADTNSGNKSAGTLRVVLATDQVNLTSALNVTSVITAITPGVAATSLGKAEDAVSADGDVGVGMLAVRKASPANTSGTDGDYEFLQMSAGRLWVDASGVTLTVAGAKTNNSAVPAATNLGVLPGIANAAAPTYTEGNQVLSSIDLTGNTRVVQPDSIVAATNITTVNLNLFSGTATTNSTVASATLNAASVGTFQVTGTYVGTLVAQGTVDGSNWVNLTGVVLAGSYITQSVLTSGQTGIFQVDIAGFTKFRVTASLFISGTATVTLEASVGTGSVGIDTAIMLDPATAPSVTTTNGLREAAVFDQTQKALLEQILQEFQAFNLSNGITSAQGPNENRNARRVLDEVGREVVSLSNSPDKVKTVNLTLTASTTETTLIPGVAGVDNRLLAIIISNTSASTSTRVDIRDATGGPVVIPLYSVGGANPVGFSLGGVAIPQNTRGNNWTAQCATSTTDIRILAIYSVN